MESPPDAYEKVEMLVDDFIARQRRGERPSMEDYVSQHPDVADEIRELFPALAAMEQAAPGSDSLRPMSSPAQLFDKVGVDEIGVYRLLREVGRGGMGVVYEAEQQSLNRRVALKVLPRQLAGDQKAVERFQREARAAARMHHTNIVPVFDVGQDEEHLFYAMQLIQGQGLDQVIGDLRKIRQDSTIKSAADGTSEPLSRPASADRSIAQSLVRGQFQNEQLGSDLPEASGNGGRKLEIELAVTETIATPAGVSSSAVLPGKSDISSVDTDRHAYYRSVAHVGLQTASALAYAHTRGIIHRDIKPSNLLLDANGVIWVTDFGLAKTGDQGMTHTGDILGTIRYMSPERFKGQCDVRADIYSLGLTLYEMLALKPTFESSDQLSLIEQVSKTEPPALRTIDRRIPRDLETIILKSIDKDLKRRYQSADELAEDLQRYISDEPIQARRTSSVERLTRWSRRNPWLATATCLAVASLLTVATVSTLFAREQQRLNQELSASSQRQQQLNDELTSASEEQQRLNDELHESNTALRHGQSRLALKQADFMVEREQLADAMLWFAESYALGVEDPIASDEALAKLSLAASRAPKLGGEFTIPESPAEVATSSGLLDTISASMGFTINGAPQHNNWMVLPPAYGQQADLAGGFERFVRIWDTQTGGFVGRPLDVGRLAAYSVDPAARQLATISLADNSEARNGRLQNGRGFQRRVLRLTIAIWNVDTGRPAFEPIVSEEGFIVAAMMSQLAIAFAPERDEIRVTRPSTRGNLLVHRFHRVTGELLGETTLSVPERGSRFLRGMRAAFSPDGTRVILSPAQFSLTRLGGRGGELVCHDAVSGDVVGKPVVLDATPHHTMPLTSDATQVATLSGFATQQRIEVWDTVKGQRTAELTNVNMPSWRTARILSGGRGGSLLVVGSGGTRAARATRNEQESNNQRFRRVPRFEPTRGQVQVWDLRSRRPLTPPIATFGPAHAASLSVDNSELAIHASRRVRTWKLAKLPMRRTVVPAPANLGVFAPPLTTRTRRQQRRNSGAISFGVSDQILVAEPADPNLRLTRWDAKTGRLIESITLPETSDESVACFSAGGQFLVTHRLAEENPSVVRIRFWSTQEGRDVGQPLEVENVGTVLALSPDGIWLAEQRFDRQNRQFPTILTFHNTQTGRKRQLRLRRLLQGPNAAHFLADGTTLVLGEIGSLRAYDVMKDELTILEVPGDEPSDNRRSRSSWTVSPDGKLLASSVDDRVLRIRSVATGEVVGSLLEHPSAVTHMSFDPAGNTLITTADDGLVRQWSLPEVWNGSPEEIATRVERHTGLRMSETEGVTVQAQTIEPRNSADLGEDEFSAALPSEVEALHARARGDWHLASDYLSDWARAHPQEGVPHLLRIRMLATDDRFDEATATLERAVELVGKETAFYWLNHELDALQQLDGRRPNAANREASDEALVWFSEALMSTATHDSHRARLLVDRAARKLGDHQFEAALRDVDQAIQIEPRKVASRQFRVRLLERMQRWQEATAELRAIQKLSSDDHLALYELAAAHLYNDDIDAFWGAWTEMFDKWFDSSAVRVPERLAKLRLLLPDGGRHLNSALNLADGAYDARRSDYPSGNSEAKAYEATDIQIKGIAEFRRGHFEQAIGFLRKSNSMFRRERWEIPAAALGKLFEAMALQQLGESNQARTALLESVDRLDNAKFQVLNGETRALDWQLGQVALREAIRVVGVEPKTVGLPLPDTSTWAPVFEESFDGTDFGPEWEPTGPWSIKDGAACATLKVEAGYDGFFDGDLRNRVDRFPNSVLIEYETWWPEGAVSEVKLLGSGRLGYIIGLSDIAHPPRVRIVNPGRGPHMLERNLSGRRWAAQVSNFDLGSNRKYQIAVLRQPERVTMFVDGEQAFSCRVGAVDAPDLSLYAFGPFESEVYFDNLRVRVPRDTAGQVRARRLTRQKQWRPAADAYYETISSSLEARSSLEEAAAELPTKWADYLAERLTGEQLEQWRKISGRPLMHSRQVFEPLDLQPSANVALKEPLHEGDRGGLSQLPQGLREFGGVQFQIGPRLLHLQRTAGDPDPRQVELDNVSRSITRLHLLHAAAFAGGMNDGTQAGQLVLHYQDGTKSELPLVIGTHFRDWHERGEPDCTDAKVVWTGWNENSRQDDRRLRLYLTTLQNPHPDKRVVKITYSSSLSGAAPFCVAMTTET